MQGFTPRDYLVSAVIILGVLTAWFLVLAGLLGITNLRISVALAIVIGLILYVVIKRRQLKS